MRLSVSKSKNATSFFVIRSIYNDGKRTSEVVKKLGNEQYIKDTYGCTGAFEWAKAYVDKLNKEEKEKLHKVLIPYHTDKRININEQLSYNIGYLFLKKIFSMLKLPSVCHTISERHSFKYDLTQILSYIVYGRILFPSSKLSCYEQSKCLFEQPSFDLQHIYRALEVIAEESDFIQSQLYHNSCDIIKRSTGVLYYDCTNFFFESEQEEGLKQYGISKEHRPNPIVQMGLFMDRSGLPLAFCINKGNTNEQTTLTPLEKTIMQDFRLSKFVVCTDAGLSSEDNKKFNNFGQRSFITTHSIKKLDKDTTEWALSADGWHSKDDDKIYNISQIEDNKENRQKVFYKCKYVEGYDEKRDIQFNQTLIITFSLKYKEYETKIRERQIDRARKAIEKNPSVTDKKAATDYKRFITKTSITKDGEVADKKIYAIDEEAIAKEAQYDGFYALYTNLDDDPADIVKIQHDRWEIEESFRIMKSEFKARPVYLKRDDRIKAHFVTCFIALLIYRLLEKKIGEKYTCNEIIHCLRNMNITKAGTEHYIPAYTRTNLTDELHQMGGFHTDYQILTDTTMKKICKKAERKN